MTAPNRLLLDHDALIANWRLLDRMSGDAACGAAVKADAYGLGAWGVIGHLVTAGCRELFVATWAEAFDVRQLGLPIAVLHGVRDEDMAAHRPGNARPVLNTREQVRRWRDGDGGVCDVMVDTGMNRLGVSVQDVADGLLDGLTIDVLMSHLASADEDAPSNAAQLAVFAALRGRTSAKRMSLANSAGIALGPDYSFDLTRPGIALYGGVVRRELEGIRQVAYPQAQILQRRRVPAGDAVGYNAQWIAPTDTEVAVINIGYADGYRRAFGGNGAAYVGDTGLPVLGRVSMDLVAIDVSDAPTLAEGDWVTLAYHLPNVSEASGVSQYELLTGLGHRFDRMWS